MDNIEAKEVKQGVMPATETPPQNEAKVNTEAPPEIKTSDGISISQKCECESTIGNDGSHNEDKTPEKETAVIADDTVPIGDPAVQEAVITAAPERNYEAEWKELADAHPELVGNQLPDDIMQACLNSTLPPIRVYESMMIVKQAAEIKALQDEIATLRQNAEAAAKAPVRATTPGGKTDTEAEDAFIRAFKSY